MSAELQAARRDSTLILTLSNPGTRNTLHPDLCAAAIEVLSTAERDDTVRAVVLTGAAGYFCAGSMFHDYRSRTKDELVDSLDTLQGWIAAIQECPKPVIAAVEGGAEGAGFSLALACDLIVSGTSATFAMPSVLSGQIAEGTAAWLLAQSLPRHMAAEILLGGKPLNAARLHALGTINRLVTDGTALDTALDWADELARYSPKALEQMKALLASALQEDLAQHFVNEKQAFVEVLMHNK